ncbi:MAG TPA: hypothetical protein VL357_03170 [Rariglobus sp.]|jgi:hypothetical protein|nr:hypothetical protein [Rariglobus sp.]
MPRTYITPEQIATARARVLKGDSQSAIARDLGVSRDAMGYHLRGGKAYYSGKRPWGTSLRAAKLALAAGNHAEAAYHFTATAKILINL